MNCNVWSGKIVEPGEALRTPVMRGDVCYVVFDIERGDLPGTVFWPDRLGDVPAGWRVIGRRPLYRDIVIARSWNLLPLRTVTITRELASWILSAGGFIRSWWQRRPPIRRQS